MISMTSDKMQGWKIKFILRTERKRKRKRELNYLSVQYLLTGIDPITY